MKYLWVGIFLISGFKNYAQIVDLRLVDQENLSLFFSENRNSGGNTIDYSDIEGSPYYVDDFNLADIYFKNGKVIEQVSVRLNLYRKSLEFQRDGAILEMTRMEGLDHLTINEEYIIYISDFDFPEGSGFYKIEIDGKYRLMQYLQVTFFDATKAANFYENDVPAKFKRQHDKYCLGIEDEVPLEFDSKRNFKKTFNDTLPELVKFADAEKLNPKKYEDLVKMVEYLNAL